MIFVFNLIVGTGALTLPSVFSKAGWLLGSVLIAVLAFVSYMTLTFIIETMSCANAIMLFNRIQYAKRQRNDSVTEEEDTRGGGAGTTGGRNTRDNLPEASDQEDLIPVEEEELTEDVPLFMQRQSVSYYSLDEKYELGVLATMFFNKLGIICFYLCMCVYLYGDLSIYNAAVARSLTDVICGGNATWVPDNSSNTTDTPWLAADEDDYCFSGSMRRFKLYQINLVGFVLILGPFTFFNVQKTKYIQILTVLLRWLAFTVMIIIASMRFFNGQADGTPPKADFGEVSNLFGACIYSFMCHHSLPSLVSPIAQKDRLKAALSLDYIWIAAFYLLLALTGAFAFQHLDDLYTLNFIPHAADGDGFTFYKLIEYFLALFPVFTLSASFPIIAITLRNNLQILFLDMARFESYSFVVRRLVFPFLAVIPPLLVTLNTENIHSLVRFTGSYAGTGIQYVIPVALIYYARRHAQQVLGQSIWNRFQSPFKSNWWLVCVLAWTVVCVCLVSINFVVDHD